jgi:hypothetical protein
MIRISDRSHRTTVRDMIAMDYNNTGNALINGTLRCVHVTTVAVGKQ